MPPLPPTKPQTVTSLRRASDAECVTASCRRLLDALRNDRKMRGDDPELIALEKEAGALLDDTHPTLKEQMRMLDDRMEEQRVRIDIEYRQALAQIEKEYAAENAAIQSESEERCNEMLAVLLSEVEDRHRAVDNEIACLDVSGPSWQSLPANKKTLRSRKTDPGDRKRKAAPPTIHYLLTEAEIATDVHIVAPELSKLAQSTPIHRVNFDNGKLTYEGKSYHKGQNLFVQTENYGQFPALIQSINDHVAHFKSTMPGDTRQVMATYDDILSGRVILKKRNH